MHRLHLVRAKVVPPFVFLFLLMQSLKRILRFVTKKKRVVLTLFCFCVVWFKGPSVVKLIAIDEICVLFKVVPGLCAVRFVVAGNSRVVDVDATREATTCFSTVVFSATVLLFSGGILVEDLIALCDGFVSLKGEDFLEPTFCLCVDKVGQCCREGTKI